MNQFGTLDWIVLVGFFIGSFLIGTFAARRQKNEEDYFLAGRKMAWLPVAISIVATNNSAGSYMGVPAYIFSKNFMLYFNNITIALVAPVVVRVFLDFYYKLNLYTAYEYLEIRFNVLVRSIASILFICLRLCWLAMMIYATSVALAEITGLSPVWCTLLLGLGTSIYTMLGGMKGVIWTGVLQGSIFIFGIIVMALFILFDFRWNVVEIYSLAAAAGRTRTFDFSLDPTVEVTFWGVLLGTFVINLASYGVDQVVLQRYLTAKSVESARKSLLVGNICIDLPFATGLYLVGVGIFSFFQKNQHLLPPDVNPDRVMPLFAILALPAGISGIVIAGLMAATMSSISAGVNSITTATITDLYQRFIKPHAPGKHYLGVSRWFSLGWGVCATVLGLFVNRLGTIFEISVKTNSFFTGILLGIFLLGMCTVRANWQGVVLGSLASLAMLICVATMTETSYLWYAPVGLGLTVLLGYLLSCATGCQDARNLTGLVLGHGKAGENSTRVYKGRMPRNPV